MEPMLHEIEGALAAQERLSRVVVTREVLAVLRKRLQLKVGCGLVG